MCSGVRGIVDGGDAGSAGKESSSPRSVSGNSPVPVTAIVTMVESESRGSAESRECELERACKPLEVPKVVVDVDDDIE